MTQGGKIRVLLADDHELVREGLGRILEAHGGIEVAARAADGPSALEAGRRAAPDVALLDYGMPGIEAPELVQMLKRELPQTRCIVISIHENIHYAIRALESGAYGYLIKSAAVRELIEAVRTVHAGEVYLSREIAQRVLQRMRRPAERSGVEALSPREFDLLRALGAGVSPGECARRLGVSTSSVSTYRSRLLEKLGLRTTPELIRFALEQGIGR